MNGLEKTKPNELTIDREKRNFSYPIDSTFDAGYRLSPTSKQSNTII